MNGKNMQESQISMSELHEWDFSSVHEVNEEALWVDHLSSMNGHRCNYWTDIVQIRMKYFYCKIAGNVCFEVRMHLFAFGQWN